MCAWIQINEKSSLAKKSAGYKQRMGTPPWEAGMLKTTCGAWWSIRWTWAPNVTTVLSGLLVYESINKIPAFIRGCLSQPCPWNVVVSVFKPSVPFKAGDENNRILTKWKDKRALEPSGEAERRGVLHCAHETAKQDKMQRERILLVLSPQIYRRSSWKKYLCLTQNTTTQTQ